MAQTAPASRLVAGVGAFDISDDQDELSAIGVLQYYSKARVLAGSEAGWFQGIGGSLGIAANTDGGVFGHGAIFTEIDLGKQVIMVPAAGIGGYSDGDSKHLGGRFQFTVMNSFYYEFRNNRRLPEGSRIGIQLMHISNADVHNRNPGANSLMAVFSLPLGR